MDRSAKLEDDGPPVSERRLESVARALAVAGFGDYVLWWDAERPILAAGVRARVLVQGATCSVRDASGQVLAQATTTDPFLDARRLLAETLAPPFRAWGYLGFGLAAFRYSSVKSVATELHLIVPELTCRLERGEVLLEGSVDAVARARAALAAVAPDAVERAAALSTVEAVETGRAAYEASVEKVLAAIRAHEVEKVILARQVVLSGRLDPLATFAAAAQTQAARRFAFALGGVVGVGACPEILLVASADGEVVTNPLAGTQPRGKTEEEDARLCANLLRDAKEVSEHASSIRLAYEEIASVCTAESARVCDFMRVKRYAFTQHLSSRAAGSLAPGRSSWDALRAVFPGVTVTGVTKAPALALIDSLEPVPRGIYGGAIGWVEDTGAMDWGIALRSAFDYGQGVTLNAGAGIVLDSSPAYEFDESAHKMRTIASRIALAD
jgi:salicylate synthetase